MGNWKLILVTCLDSLCKTQVSPKGAKNNTKDARFCSVVPCNKDG